ncbi:MAG: rod shape-determining protein MreD [Microcoleaceae cyanobacterium]
MSIWMRQLLNRTITVASLVGCALLSLSSIPGINLFGVSPNWLLIWLVAWSVRHTLLESAIAGLMIGAILDGLTAPMPTHLITYGLAGMMTVLIYQRIVRKMQENFISIALVVFGMVILVEALQALQVMVFQGGYQAIPLNEFWLYQQRITLSSAIISSLWAPVLCFPLHRWWEFVEVSRRINYSA